ncbi:hypothetical protein J6590_036131 [Homalodisca vitripennis]|nr:hypothetical protein J6590_036131 [Homalodisca vitripennis]
MDPTNEHMMTMGSSLDRLQASVLGYTRPTHAQAPTHTPRSMCLTMRCSLPILYRSRPKARPAIQVYVCLPMNGPLCTFIGYPDRLHRTLVNHS